MGSQMKDSNMVYFRTANDMKTDQVCEESKCWFQDAFVEVIDHLKVALLRRRKNMNKRCGNLRRG
jgi:hypothetical protein